MQYSSHSAEATTLDWAVAYFLTDTQPVYTIEKSGFMVLVCKLNPQYSLPSRKHFTEVKIPKLCAEVRETVGSQSLLKWNSFLPQLTCGPAEPSILTSA